MYGIVNQMLLYGRPTIGPSYDLSVTSTALNQEYTRPGLYLVCNLGPDPCNVRVFNDGTDLATVADMVLWPAGSGDRCEIGFQVGMVDVKATTTHPIGGNPQSYRFLSAITSALNTATLRVTQLTLV